MTAPYRALNVSDREQIGVSGTFDTLPPRTIFMADVMPVLRTGARVPAIVSRRIVERIDFLAEGEGQAIQAVVLPDDVDPSAGDEERLQVAAEQEMYLKFDMRISWSNDTIIELRWPVTTHPPVDDLDLLQESPGNES